MTLREALRYEPQELAFGTSGLRGLASDMTDLECYINVVGFLDFMAAHDTLRPDSEVYVAGDLRDSTPRILSAVHRAITDSGYRTVYSGLVPTPTLSLESLAHAVPGIMVTGSHIPADRNGIKFVKSAAEVMKADEAPIKQAVAAVRKRLYETDKASSIFDHDGFLIDAPELPAIDAAAVARYRERYLSLFDDRPLEDKTIVFYQHSAVGRDLLAELLEELGANVIREGRSDVFVPIDTEHVTAENEAYFRELAEKHPGLFAIVSTDGDSDRPFVVDETGTFHMGDVLGVIVAQWLGLDSAAYPVTTSDAVDTVLAEHHVPTVRTKIGSPYVIEAMDTAIAAGHGAVGGWEVNGGFLLGSDFTVNGHLLTALPTRDAFIAILAALLAAQAAKTTVSAIFEALPQRFSQASLIDDVPLEFSRTLLATYGTDTPEHRRGFAELMMPGETDAQITSINTTDGLRATFASGDIIHLRPSGNAPQLRVYSVADTPARADRLVQTAITSLRGRLAQA